MSKAVKGYEQLIKDKQRDIADFYRLCEPTISWYLKLQKELEELKSKRHKSRMNEVDLITKKK